MADPLAGHPPGSTTLGRRGDVGRVPICPGPSHTQEGQRAASPLSPPGAGQRGRLRANARATGRAARHAPGRATGRRALGRVEGGRPRRGSTRGGVWPPTGWQWLKNRRGRSVVPRSRHPKAATRDWASAGGPAGAGLEGSKADEQRATRVRVGARVRAHSPPERAESVPDLAECERGVHGSGAGGLRRVG